MVGGMGRHRRVRARRAGRVAVLVLAAVILAVITAAAVVIATAGPPAAGPQRPDPRPQPRPLVLVVVPGTTGHRSAAVQLRVHAGETIAILSATPTAGWMTAAYPPTSH
jgi:hypothetical protein